MEAEDDMIVLVVVDDEEKTNIPSLEIKREPECSPEDAMEVTDIIETAEKHGEYIVKIEPEELECDFLEDEVLQVLWYLLSIGTVLFLYHIIIVFLAFYPSCIFSLHLGAPLLLLF